MDVDVPPTKCSVISSGDEVPVSVEEGELLEETLEDGVRLRLVRRAGLLEVWAGDSKLFGEARRRADRDFADFALAPVTGRDDLVITLAGLGSGLLARALIDIPGVRELQILERSAAIVAWERAHFARLNGGVTSDPRVTVQTVELASMLSAPGGPSGRFALVLDVDSSTAAPSRPENTALYDPAGIALLVAALRPGGVIAMASTRREPELLRQLSARMQNVAEIAAPVDAEPGALDYFYRARKPPAASAAPRGAN